MGWTPKQSSVTGDPTIYEGRLATVEAKVSDAAKQTATLKQGLQVISTDQASPLNVLNFKGRTLVNLGAQQTMDAAKSYLFYSLNGKAGIKLDGESSFTYGYKTFTGKAAATYSLRDDFKGKVAGSTVEVPHIVKDYAYQSLVPPNDSKWDNREISNYAFFDKLDNIWKSSLTNTSGLIVQQLFSFNLIAIAERKFGIGFFIGCSTVAQKVQRLKDRLSKVVCNMYGFGSGPNGNILYTTVYRVSTNVWDSPFTTTSNAPENTLRVVALGYVADRIDSNGFMHFLAYADASDGVTASTVNADYVDITLEYAAASYPFKSGSRLYEITAAEKTKMDAMTTTDRDAYIAADYPFVEDVKHVWSPVVEKKGKNLLPPFTQWKQNEKLIFNGPYDVDFGATSPNLVYVEIPNMPGTKYTLSFGAMGGKYSIQYRKGFEDSYLDLVTDYRTSSEPYTFTSQDKGAVLRINFNNDSVGKVPFTNPQLELGTVATPFEPQNNDYLYFPDVKLAGDASVVDQLVQRDGGFVKVKRWETDVVLDGVMPWQHMMNYTGYKRAMTTVPISIAEDYTKQGDKRHYSSKWDGKIISNVNAFDGTDQAILQTNAAGGYKVTVANSESGLTNDAYNPTPDEWKAYFNGWQAKTVDGAGKPTAWRNIADGTDAPTQTLEYVKANRAPGYTPYKLTYQLATPVEVPVNAEGAIALHQGGNQIDVGAGVVVREKVTPVLRNNEYWINNTVIGVTSYLKNKAEKILKVYKNGAEDKDWKIGIGGNAYGASDANIKKELYDPNAEYSVTYTALDKHLLTSSPDNIAVEYNTNVKTVVQQNTQQLADLKRDVSINVNAVAELYKRVKSLGG